MDSTSNVTGQPNFIVATGGTITCCGDYKIHTFTADGTFTICSAPTPANNNVDYLVVAGGGGGGGFGGGGGGAGGFRVSNSTSMPAPLTSPLANPTGLPVSVTLSNNSRWWWSWRSIRSYWSWSCRIKFNF
jgi:hypothetical protein